MKKKSRNHKDSYVPFAFTKGSYAFDFKNEIAEMIIEARIAKGISQEELAKKIGIKQPNIARWENGNHFPSYASLEKIAKALNTELIPPKFKFIGDKDKSANVEIVHRMIFNYDIDTKTTAIEYKNAPQIKVV